MTNRKQLAIRWVVALAVTLPITHFASAQTPAWPTRTVRLVVPFSAGGAADATARTIATKLAEKWGQAVVVDNKPGGNTVVGASEMQRVPADGYTLLQAANSSLTLNPFTFARSPYDPLKDFTHIARIVTVPLVFVANDREPIKSIPELIALAKKSPGTVTIGGASVGSQLAVERFSRDAGIKLSYVPYKTGVEITKGLLSGEIQTGIDGAAQYLPLAKSGKIRFLATNLNHRIGILPDVPTLTELGLKNSEAGLWHGISAPPGLPAGLQTKIADDLRTVLAMPDVARRLAEFAIEPDWATSADYVKAIRQESAFFEPLIKELGLKME